MNIRKSWALVSLAIALALMNAGCDRAPQSAQTAQPAAPASSEEQDPEQILTGMAEFLAGQERFSVSIKAAYDVVQDSGQKIEFGEARKVTISRPNRMRIEVEDSDGERRLVLFDGSNVTLYGVNRNLYAQAPLEGSVDKAVYHFIQKLHLRMPLAMLMVSRLPQEIEGRVQSVDYVESTSMYGVPAHHLAGTTGDVDFQLWVTADGKPLPQRVVLTYVQEKGQPQFRAQFSDWNLSPRMKDSMFVFEPPSDAKKIAFLNQLPPPPSGKK